MKKENLRKYKDLHSDNPQNIGPALTPKSKKTKNDWGSDYWLKEQYNRNRPFKEHKRLCDTINNVNHPRHYGGIDNPYEAIKVIESWDLNFNLGNVVKYISRAGKKQDKKEDLQKAAWYINRELKKLK